MYCTRKVAEDIYWIGGSDRRLALFENLFPIPRGVAYNSYLIMDEKTVVMDTADSSITRQFIENIAHVLNGRPLDYLVVNHMEPDFCPDGALAGGYGCMGRDRKNPVFRGCIWKLWRAEWKHL